MKTFRIVCALFVCMLWVTPVVSQEESSKSMELVRDAAKSIKLKKSYLSKFDAVIPGKKVMTYYQLENKIGAVIRFDLAGEIPLALQ